VVGRSGEASAAKPAALFDNWYWVMLTNYLPVLIFLVLATVLAAVLLGLGTLLGRLSARHPDDPDKVRPYECGFDAFEDARARFDVRYYLVAILFIVFDLEIAFLFPWAVSLGRTGAFGLIAMAIFLTILVVGFIYEWRKGALEWD
jgi:NADH-quinone oxidoreductase subunit A